MIKKIHIYSLLAFLFVFQMPLIAESATNEEAELDIKNIILDHLADSYEWEIISTGEKDISLHLPVILYSKTSGWHCFSSSKLKNGEAEQKGFYLASDGKYKGKIVELDAEGNHIRPLDLSFTKNAASIMITSLILILLVVSVAKAYKKDPLKPKKGFVGMMEMFILMITDDLIKPSVGKDYKRYSPYLLTVFLFIFLNNLVGLIPFFPGGANVTGNISVTVVLAVGTFLVINLTGNKAYYKSIFWPDVPVFLKFPIPLMPIIEIIGLFTKPFALMIRLFANIMAGHAIVLGLIMIVFVTVNMGPVINTSMTVISVLFTVFISFIELMVAFIQAYVFTLLSAVFIGMARAEEP